MTTIFCKFIGGEISPSVCRNNFQATKSSCKTCSHNPQNPKPLTSSNKREITKKDAVEQISPLSWFTENERQELARVLSVSHISERDWSLLNRIRQSCLIDKGLIEKNPRPKKTGLDNLKEIKELINSLIERIKNLDDYGKDVLFRLAPETCSSIQEGHSDIHRLNDALDDALSTLKPDKGGRNPTPAVKETIIMLADFFEKVTDRQAGYTQNTYTRNYEGPFFNFVRTFLEIVTPDAFHSNTSLGKQIIASLNLRKKADKNGRLQFGILSTL
ncbi:MAG: hypothetical protein AB1711_10650 [Thermodesulfobacteriota bacterium]